MDMQLNSLTRGVFHLHFVSSKMFSQNLCIAEISLCMCAQSTALALGTRTKFQIEILIRSMISDIVYVHKITLESLWNISETIPWWLYITQYCMNHDDNIIQEIDKAMNPHKRPHTSPSWVGYVVSIMNIYEVQNSFTELVHSLCEGTVSGLWKMVEILTGHISPQSIVTKYS